MSVGFGTANGESLAVALQRACPDIGLHPEHDDDLEFLRGLYASVRAPELAPIDWSEQRKREFTDAQFALQGSHYREHYPGAEFLVIEQAGVPIGRFYLCRFAHEIRVMDIALVEARRNAGIGTRLMRALLDVADAEGRSVTLHVEPDNPAQHLYRRLGFALIEPRGVYDFLGRPLPVTASATRASPDR